MFINHQNWDGYPSLRSIEWDISNHQGLEKVERSRYRRSHDEDGSHVSPISLRISTSEGKTTASKLVSQASVCCDGIRFIIPNHPTLYNISKIYRWIVHKCSISQNHPNKYQNPYSLNILSFRTPISSLGQGFTTIFRYDVAVGLWRATGRPLQRILCASSSDFCCDWILAIGDTAEIRGWIKEIRSKKSEYLEEF